MAVVKARKRTGSKKTKKGWRKSDIQDVEDFLEDKRLEERLGVPFKERKDDDLFAVDTSADNANLVKYETSKALRRKELLSKPPRCFEILKNDSKVSDPIAKRNIRRSAEERKHPVLRKKEETLRGKGILKRKEVDRIRTKAVTAIKSLIKKPRKCARKDVWDEERVIPAQVASEWVNPATKLHVLNNTRLKKLVMRPKEPVATKPYVTPALEVALPGMSYNPTFEDHVSLLDKIAEKETKLIEEEKHLHRVTVAMFRKVPRHVAEAQYMEEMSKGIPALDPEAAQPDEPTSDNEYHAVNPPINRLKKKDRIKRRNMKEESRLQGQIKTAKLEKRKLADIYRLKKLEDEISTKDEEDQKNLVKRKEKRALKTTRRLGRNKFEERELDFNMASDLKGSLRNIKPEGNLLADRYISFQKRNIMEVTAKQNKLHTKKKKTFVRSSHKIDFDTHPLLSKKKPVQGKKKKGSTLPLGQN